jgi:hypothetical protein
MKASRFYRRDWLIATAVSLLTLILGATAVYLHSSLTFFSNDIGLRFLQVRSLIESGRQTFAVPYPARFLDPELAYPPFYYAYLLLEDQFFLNISPYLPLFTSFLYPIIGFPALSVLPALSGVGTAAALYKLGRLTGIRRSHLLLWSAILATPLLFYSLTFWDHTLGTVCAVGAVVLVAYGLQNGRLTFFFLGGIAAALGVGQRVEIYIFVVALGIATFSLTWNQWRRWGALLLGVITGIIPIWVTQYLWFDNPLGLVLASYMLGYGVPDAYPIGAYTTVTLTKPIIVGRLLLYIEAADPLTFSAALLVIVGTFLFIFMVRIPHWRKPILGKVSLFMLLIGYTLFVGLAWQRVLPGLITTFPLLALALAYGSGDGEQGESHFLYRFVYTTTLLFLGLMIVLWPAYGGNQWGARYLLPAYPLLLFLAFYTYSRWRDRLDPFTATVRQLFTILLVVSMALQLLRERSQITLEKKRSLEA